MKNHKQLLADFYLALLAIPENEKYEWISEEFENATRNELASIFNETPETVERIFKKMVLEDKK